jgi:predicted nucleic acid-binding protein
MLYADSCYLVKYYCVEAGSAEVRRLFANEQIACVALGQAELTSAFHRKFREGFINQAIFTALVRQLKADLNDDLWTWLPVTADLLNHVSATFALLPANVYLRTTDALHLAAAQTAALKEIYSNDRHLLAAAPRFGLRGVNVITAP